VSVLETWSKAEAEALRQARVNASGILWRAKDPCLAAIVADAAAQLDAPIAYLSILDGSREWLPIAVGMAADEIDRAHCFYEGVETRAVTCLSDIGGTPALAGHPLLAGPPTIAFAAWAPLTVPSGELVGALCVLDIRSRPAFSPVEREKLAALAAALVAEIGSEQSKQAYGSWSIDLLVEQLRDAAGTDSQQLIVGLDDILRDVERAIGPRR